MKMCARLPAEQCTLYTLHLDTHDIAQGSISFHLHFIHTYNVLFIRNERPLSKTLPISMMNAYFACKPSLPSCVCVTKHNTSNEIMWSFDFHIDGCFFLLLSLYSANGYVSFVLLGMTLMTSVHGMCTYCS